MVAIAISLIATVTAFLKWFIRTERDHVCRNCGKPLPPKRPRRKRTPKTGRKRKGK